MFPLFILDQVNEEVDGAVEGCQKVTQTGDQLDPIRPVLNLKRLFSALGQSGNVMLSIIPRQKFSFLFKF